METKRLFIGGLHSDIKEADLRDRFKTFGSVSSVEIVRRTDDEGCPVKTFAYLDITQTERDFKSCVSLLSKSKWKGCSLKVQAAKESFLTRLNRERLQKDQENTGNEPIIREREETRLQHGIPEALPKAVPGTPLPGKKNWVVGKFGRVLPVVYLRRRDRRKIAKFDPSKTTHCLKRINVEEPKVVVSELTWNLVSEKDIINGSLPQKEGKSKLRENDKKQTDLTSVKARAFYENTVQKHEKKSSSKIPENNSVNFPVAKLSASGGSDLESVASNSYSESDSSRCSYTKFREISPNKTTTDKRNFSEIAKPGCTITPSRNTVKICNPSENIDSIALYTPPRRERDVLSNGSSDSRMRNSRDVSCDTLLHNNGAKDEEDDEALSELSEEIGSTESEVQSSCSAEETSGSSSSENGDNINVSSTDSRPEKSTESLCKDSEEPPLKEGKTKLTKGQLTLKDDIPKKKISNEKRLGALEEKKKSILAQKNAVKDALKDLDSGVQSRDGKKHIVFGGDNDEDSSGDTQNEKDAYSLGEKISGSKASSWLGLDSDSDEGNAQVGDGSDGEGDHLFTLKPQFEGKSGEQLFKLQRTFGGDKRFELDSRFLESDDEDSGHDDYNKRKETAKVNAQESLSRHDDDKEDDIRENLKHEKEMAMKVLSSILGGDFRAKFGHGESQEKVPEFRSSAAVHYDPTREDHEEFEQTDAEEKEKQGPEPIVVKETRSADPVLPEVSGDKYYDVNTSSLAELFGNKEQGSSTFSFLSQGLEGDADSTAAEDSHVGSAEEIMKNPWQTTAKLPYDSSGDDDDDDDGDDMHVEDTDGDQSSKSTSHLDALFFFHPDDPKLANRINDQVEPFMRTGSQEEVKEYWVSVRSELTQDYKRKRKDAVRRQNKLAAKRSRHK